MPGLGRSGSLNEHFEAPRSSATPPKSQYISPSPTAPFLLAARLVFRWISRGKARFDPPGATSTAATTTETCALTAGLRSRTDSGSAVSTVVPMDDLLQRDPLNQEFTPGIASLSSSLPSGLAREWQRQGEEQSPRRSISSPEALRWLPVPPRQ